MPEGIGKRLRRYVGGGFLGAAKAAAKGARKVSGKVTGRVTAKAKPTAAQRRRRKLRKYKAAKSTSPGR